MPIDLYYDRRKEDLPMEFTEMKNLLLQLQQTDYRNFVKALVAIETNCNDEEKLESLYEKFMEEDTAALLNEEITGKAFNY